MKSFLPLNIRIDNRKILFVGGGKIALHKIKTVAQYTRNITILAPEITDELHQMEFTEIRNVYEKSDLAGFFLLYACTNDQAVNRRIQEDAAACGILVNVVDNRELSDFISPAVIKQREMTIAVSSNGENVKKSVAWRNRLKTIVQQRDFCGADQHENPSTKAITDDAARASESFKKGFVYLIGAGPGDPELLTLKAARLLREAEVILYDDLVSDELIAHYNALKICTGKRKNSHAFEQEAINAEILRHALQGKVVARLKGGDPFIFGRGGEEIQALRDNGIGYEIIPGITAAQGASAYTEIPLTLRQVSSSVAFCTGHPANKIEVPATGTIVFYMVATTLHEVLDAVAKKGWHEQTPVALVQNATRYNQSVMSGTLGEWRRKSPSITSPALLFIGDTIPHAIAENWFSRKKKVLIVGDDCNRYDVRDAVKLFFSGKLLDGAEPLEFAFIDEIFFASPESVANFCSVYQTLPQHLIITTADEATRAACERCFGGDTNFSH
jgi:uroporphyrin-III C-methyltransferase